MEGISKQELIRVKENMPDGTSKLFVHTLITMCKELPDQQWQTIEEFKANPVDGWCWICAQGSVDHAWYYSDNFWLRDNSGTAYFDVTHVMPIKTPEAPKLD